MKYAFSRFSHIHLKFSRNLLLNLPLQQSFKESCKRLHYDKPISFRTVARKGRLKGFLVPATVGISGIVAGLSVFKFYSYLSKELSFPLPIQKVYASSGDILKTAGNNFIADAVDLAAPAVVFLRVKRWAHNAPVVCYHCPPSPTGNSGDKDFSSITALHCEDLQKVIAPLFIGRGYESPCRTRAADRELQSQKIQI